VQTDWNSFNVGEFLFPLQRASLIPLLIICGGLIAGLVVAAARRDREGERMKDEGGRMKECIAAEPPD
jgi:hypothetical protein